MAKKEQAILEVKIEQKSLIADLEKSKRSLIQNKQELQELNKAYKAGSITLEEYASDAVRLEAIIKKQSTAYQNGQKAITGHKSKIDELIKSMDKLGGGFSSAAKDMNIAGVNIGNLGSKFASFLTPAGAAVGVITALVGAYASSASGAKDLEKATDQLSASFSIALNSFGGLVDELKDSTNRGVFEQAAFQISRIFGEGAANRGRAVADAKAQLQRIEIANEFAKGFAKEREREAENLRRIRDDDTKTTIERLEQIDKIEQKITNSGEIRVITLMAQIEAIKDISTSYKNDLEAQLAVAKVETEIKDINEAINGKLTENLNVRAQLLKLAQQEAEALKNADVRNRANAKTPNAIDSVTTITDTNISGGDIKIEADRAAMRLSSQKRLADDLNKINKDHAEKEIGYRIHALEISKKIEDEKFAIASEVAGNLASLFDQQTTAFKVFASAQTLIATYSSAQKSYDSLSGIPFIGPALGFAAAAAAVLAGLKNLQQIHNVQFAEGGWTGPGSKYQPAGIVHADEYVTPKQVVNNPMAKPHLQALESMRLRGYADGGFVTNQNTMSAQASLAMVNAIKQLPTPEVSVKEITRTQRRVSVRESTTKIGGKSINRM